VVRFCYRSDLQTSSELMTEPAKHGSLLRFASFEVNLESGVLRKQGFRIKLQEKPFQVLVTLLERPGDLITREELHRRLWNGNTFVDFDHNLNNAVTKLREALNDSSDRPRLIETIPRRGYRFIGSAYAVRGESNSKLPATEPRDARRAFEAGSPLNASEVQSGLSKAIGVSKPTHTSRVWFAAAFISVLCLVSTGLLIRGLTPPRNYLATPQTTLVVLPFQNLTGDPSNEFLCDGMTEEMISRLGSLNPQRLGVIARTTSMYYKGLHVTAGEIGNKLNVDYVMESSLRQNAQRIRITIQLIDARSERHIWSQTYDRDMRDIMGMETEVAIATAKEIQPALIPGDITVSSTTTPEVYENYLKGRYFWDQRTRDGLLKGVAFFEAAIDKDPRYAPAYAGLADSYLVLGDGFIPAGEAYPKAMAAAQTAIAIDDTNSEAHASLGLLKMERDSDWDGAERELRRAIQLNPSNLEAHNWFAYLYIRTGHSAEAIPETELCVRLNPLSPFAHYHLGGIYTDSRQFALAHKEFEKALELNPRLPMVHGAISYLETVEGKYSEALTEARQAEQLTGLMQPWAADQAYLYGRLGQQSDARNILQRFQEYEQSGNVTAFSFVLCYLGLGDNERALATLEKAYDDRSFSAWNFLEDVRLKVLHSDVRFLAYRKRFHLPD
jgi:TolB-like protein/DNA-binding winged helix-turn-helix (wHTH) protein/Flp pilus assembly protein TadD